MSNSKIVSMIHYLKDKVVQSINMKGLKKVLQLCYHIMSYDSVLTDIFIYYFH
jgi:hypothetical protein